MGTPTALPCQGRIVEFAEDSGTIQTEHGTRVRFGRTSCSGFEPRVGHEVWVMATRMMPVVGERATLVNLTGAVEASDPAARARQRRETDARELQERHDAEVGLKRTFGDRVRSSTKLPATWRPGLVALNELIKLPAALSALSTLDERAGAAIAARVQRHKAVASEIHTDVIFEQHRADDVPLRICVGSCELRPIHDSCLVPFAQIDGEEPNLYALYYHPDLYHLRNALPVVHWSHDDCIGFVAADAEMFVAAVAHGRLAHNGQIVKARPGIARLTGLADPGGIVETRRGRSLQIYGAPEFPPELAQIVHRTAEQQRAAEDLAVLSLGDDYAAIIESSEALERRYRELAWPYQERHIQFQRLRFFEE